VEAVEEKACAPRIDHGRAEGFEGLGSRAAKSVQIVEIGSGEFFEPALGGGAEVELGVMEAEGLAPEGG